MGPSNRPPVVIREFHDAEYDDNWVEISWRRGCLGASMEFPKDKLSALRDALNDYLG